MSPFFTHLPNSNSGIHPDIPPSFRSRFPPSLPPTISSAVGPQSGSGAPPLYSKSTSHVSISFIVSCYNWCPASESLGPFHLPSWHAAWHAGYIRGVLEWMGYMEGVEWGDGWKERTSYHLCLWLLPVLRNPTNFLKYHANGRMNEAWVYQYSSHCYLLENPTQSVLVQFSPLHWRSYLGNWQVSKDSVSALCDLGWVSNVPCGMICSVG